MQAYAEGFDIFKNANSNELPEEQRFELDIPEIAEVWRRGSVVGSWLLDLTAMALVENPTLAEFTGFVQDSGEGRWTVAAVEEARRPRCSRPRSTPGSARGRSTPSPRRSSRPCGTSSAATSSARAAADLLVPGSPLDGCPDHFPRPQRHDGASQHGDRDQSGRDGQPSRRRAAGGTHAAPALHPRHLRRARAICRGASCCRPSTTSTSTACSRRISPSSASASASQGRPRRVAPRPGPATASRSSRASRSTRATGPTSRGPSSTSQGASTTPRAYQAAQGRSWRRSTAVRHPRQPGLLPRRSRRSWSAVVRRAAQGRGHGRPTPTSHTPSRASSSRSRSAATWRAPARSIATVARRVRREPDLPDRPLPRQGDGPEPDGAPVRQQHLRAALEQQVHRPRPDHRGRGRGPDPVRPRDRAR